MFPIVKAPDYWFREIGLAPGPRLLSAVELAIGSSVYPKLFGDTFAGIPPLNRSSNGVYTAFVVIRDADYTGVCP